MTKCRDNGNFVGARDIVRMVAISGGDSVVN
jgi:hypothetical protein